MQYCTSLRHVQAFMHRKLLDRKNYGRTIDYYIMHFGRTFQNKEIIRNTERYLYLGNTFRRICSMKVMITPSPLLAPVRRITSQSILLPGPEGARGSCFMPDGKLLDYFFDDARTLYDVMYRGDKHSNNGPCLAERPEQDLPYKYFTYNEVIKRIQNFASGLIQLEIQPGQNTFIGIYSHNCSEWVIAEHACYHISAINIPLSDSLGPSHCTMIINQAELHTVICDNEEKVKRLLNNAKSTPKLRKIIMIEEVSEETRIKGTECGISLIQFRDIEILGEAYPFESIPPKPDDLCTICYTSGTTGNPKGAMLTHSNVIAYVSSSVIHMDKLTPGYKDIVISYLPMSHMFERIIQVSCYMAGGMVGFFKGDMNQLFDDIKILKPTIMPIVPLLLNRIYNEVHRSVSRSRIKQWLLDVAVQKKLELLKRHNFSNNTLWDKFVFKKLQDKLGGQLRLIITGSAPVDGKVLTFLRCVMGCRILEGYGQTESSAAGTLSLNNDIHCDQVGAPVPCCHIKLIDVPEMDYYTVGNKGEVCIRGNVVFKGYLKNPEKTAEVLDKDGWLHTGDIGMWTEYGALRIIDRKDHIFKLAQGEYIVPEKIENIYLRCPYINQIFIFGESLRSCLVAIVVPQEHETHMWCLDNEVKYNWEEICLNKTFKSMLMENMLDIGKKAGLLSHEQVKDIYISPSSFTKELDLLGPTLKIKRRNCQKFFKHQIEDMYKHLR